MQTFFTSKKKSLGSKHASSGEALRIMIEFGLVQNTGDALGQHGLAGPGRTDHENVMRSGSGDFHASLCVLLPIVTVSSDE